MAVLARNLTDRFGDWLGRAVVLDLHDRFVVLGDLAAVGADHVELADADLHDLRDTATSRENYVVKAARLGVQPNRARLVVRLAEIVGAAALEDVSAG